MARLYKINEIFYSLQGEGEWAGAPALFVRFSGCNLKCSFCDTDFSRYSLMTADDVAREVAGYGCVHLVFTGGEPFLSLDKELIDAVRSAGIKFIQIETNGTVAPADDGLYDLLDWITCSPKASDICLKRIEELKVLYGDGLRDPRLWESHRLFPMARKYVQPCDSGDPQQNQKTLAQAIEFVKENPQWSLSVQLHKLLHIQ